MLAVNDLFYLASPYVTNLFYEDVMQWLDEAEIRYTPRVKIAGKSGYDHMFDFIVPKFRSHPERVIQTLGNAKKDTAEALVFKWLDTRETRSSDAQLYAFLNDGESEIPSSVISALENYELKPILWSRREGVRGELAA